LNFFSETRLTVSASGTVSQAQRCGLALLLAIACAFALVPFGPALPQAGLDASWAWVLNEAVARHLVFGRDVIFTFGPLGFVYTKLYHPATDIAMLWACATLACGTLAALYAMTTLRNAVYVALLPLLVAALEIPDAFLIFLPVLFLLASEKLMQDEHAADFCPAPLRFVLLLVMASALALLPLIKGTLGVVAFGGVACMAINVARRSIARGTAVLAVFAITLLSAWALVGQPWQELLGYFRAMPEIVSGYTTAMATDGKFSRIATFVLVAPLTLAILYRRYGTADAIARIGLVLFASGCAFIAFKSAFVRHDVGHVQAASGFLLLMVWLCVAIDPPRKAGVWLLVAVLGWAVSFHRPLMELQRPVLQIAGNVSGLWLRATKQDWLLERYNDSVRYTALQHRLPALVGPTDIYPVDHAVVIANGLQWSPRPVFQSYAAYTPALAAANALSLQQEQSPQNILFAIAPLDDRYPALEEGPSWPALMTRYAATQRIDSYILLQKDLPPVRAPEFGTLLIDTPLDLGDRLALPSEPRMLWAEVDWQPTLLGKLAVALFKLPTPRMTVELPDGSSRDYRFLPSVSSAGFVVSPQVERVDDFLAMLTPVETEVSRAMRVVAIRFHCGERLWRFLWQQSVRVRVRELTIPSQARAIELLGN